MPEAGEFTTTHVLVAAAQAGEMAALQTLIERFFFTVLKNRWLYSFRQAGREKAAAEALAGAAVRPDDAPDREENAIWRMNLVRRALAEWARRGRSGPGRGPAAALFREISLLGKPLKDAAADPAGPTDMRSFNMGVLLGVLLGSPGFSWWVLLVSPQELLAQPDRVVGRTSAGGSRAGAGDAGVAGRIKRRGYLVFGDSNRRNPKLSSRSEGPHWNRSAARQSSAMLTHAPPRST